MDADDRQGQLDEAFDRIEETILPCIAMMLEQLLEAAESGVSDGGSPQALGAELRTLALQLETLTREIEAISPVRVDAGRSRGVKASRG